MWAVHHAIRDFCDRYTLGGGESVTYRRNARVKGDVVLAYSLRDMDRTEYLNRESDAEKDEQVLNILLTASKGEYGELNDYYVWQFRQYLIALFSFLREAGFEPSRLSGDSELVSGDENVIFFGRWSVLAVWSMGDYVAMRDGSDLKAGAL